MLYKFIINNNISGDPFGIKLKANIVSPYFKANIGKTYVEGQIYYLWGELKAEETPVTPRYDNRNIDSYSWYLMGKYNIGPAYVGAMYAYVRGDDPETDDIEGTESISRGFGGGADWNPCLILWNGEFNKWVGDMGFDPGSSSNYEMMNASLYQVFCGASPIEKLSVSASYTFAKANEKQGRLAADYGQEIDLSATYKIFDNLDYMVGFGYLITGDFYKGATDSNQIDDDYLLLNRLTVNF
jgi:predicted porin